jgi:hypothetical protein
MHGVMEFDGFETYLRWTGGHLEPWMFNGQMARYGTVQLLVDYNDH